MNRQWHGVNIDADEDAIAAFDRVRPNDSNVLAAVSDTEEVLEYTKFRHGAINTLDPAMRRRQEKSTGAHAQVVKVVQVKTRPLVSLLDAHVPSGQEIGLLSVDVEGMDYRVLSSNDWTRYRPFLVVVETHGMKLDRIAEDPVHQLLSGVGYRLASHCFVTSIYLRQDPGGPLP